MRLIFVRHGDPDYEHDCLTEQGKIEAQMASERIVKIKVDEFFASPLGRAQETAAYTLKKNGRSAVTLPWLREFDGTSIRPDIGHETLAWDWLPADYASRPGLYDREKWMDVPEIKNGSAGEKYKEVIGNFDKLLAEHGYVRRADGCYEVRKPNDDTLLFFCHFGVTCVIVSHLIGCSPMVLWQGTIAAPTSLTTLYTEERREGTAAFRVTSFGDTSHLYVNGVEPAFSGRFCELYTNDNERHD